MIGFDFYRYLLPSPLVDDSRVESYLWFDERGEKRLLLVCKKMYFGEKIVCLANVDKKKLRGLIMKIVKIL